MIQDVNEKPTRITSEYETKVTTLAGKILEELSSAQNLINSLENLGLENNTMIKELFTSIMAIDNKTYCHEPLNSYKEKVVKIEEKINKLRMYQSIIHDPEEE